MSSGYHRKRRCLLSGSASDPRFLEAREMLRQTWPDWNARFQSWVFAAMMKPETV